MTPFAERVLDLVDEVPPGRVVSYGDIAGYLGEGGPRQVGRVMALWGGGVPWWRVIHADGTPPPGHERAALAHYREEGTPLRSAPAQRLPAPRRPRAPARPAAPDGPVRVDMNLARWRGGQVGTTGRSR
jgi:alkylated DNA nucleotide flippase Atl1